MHDQCLDAAAEAMTRARSLTLKEHRCLIVLREREQHNIEKFSSEFEI